MIRQTILMFWLIFGITYSGTAQINYVPNGSFEIIDTCPDPNLVPYRAIYYAKPWFQPYSIDNSTDLFNACDTNSNSLGVPNNACGYQTAESGVGYAGICIGSGGINVREYLEVELLYSLQPGREYCISFYINLSEWGQYAVDKIEGHFSINPVYYSSPAWGVLPLSADIESVPGNLLLDSIGWMHVTDTYIANGGEKYLTIGSFKTDSQLNVIIKKPGAPPYAYYFIDNIEIYDCDSVTSIKEISQDFIIFISPNPGSLFEISYQGYGKSYLEIFSVDSRLIYSENISESYGTSKFSFDASDFSNGFYYVRLRSGDYMGISRVIVQH